MTTFWHGQDMTMAAAKLTVGGTFAAALLALVGIGWQLRSQAKQSRDAIAENERRKLKAAMYEDAIAVIRGLADASIELSTPILIMSQEVRAVAEAAAAGHQFPLPHARVPDLMAKWSAFSEAAIRFIFLVEDRRFIDPRLLVFRSAINSVLYDARELMNGPLFPKIVDLLPLQAPSGEMLPYTAPSLSAAEEFRALSVPFLAALNDATTYTEDFSVEMQNLLVADLFGRKVTHRAPIDPASKVISLDRYQELEAWFNNSTPWGQKCAQIDAETRQRFALVATDAPNEGAANGG